MPTNSHLVEEKGAVKGYMRIIWEKLNGTPMKLLQRWMVGMVYEYETLDLNWVLEW
jgi:hypothetical protein